MKTADIRIEYQELLKKISVEDILSQLAGEAADLSAAASKLCRVIRGKESSPAALKEALESLKEEYADVTLCAEIIDLYADRKTIERKLRSWFDRCGEHSGDHF